MWKYIVKNLETSSKKIQMLKKNDFQRYLELVLTHL
jgi:hypothetical protein